MYFTYILYSSKSDKYYIGQTNCIKSRLKKHNSGKIDATKSQQPWVLVLAMVKPNRSDAMILEEKLKTFERKKLKKFIEKYSFTRF